MFLSVIENFSEIPNFLILECVNSVSVPMVYFSIGVSLISATSKESFASVYLIFIDLKFLRDFKCVLVKFLKYHYKFDSVL